MQSVQVIARGRAEFVQVPKPDIESGHVLIRTSYLSLCGSDIQMLHYAADNAYPFPAGTSGHEMVGTIEAVGDADSKFSAGDRVLSLAPGHRAMCEYYLAPYEHLVPLPDGKSMEVLLQSQQLGTVLYASKRLPNLVGKNVVVVGQGSAGLWFNFQLRSMGAKHVVALDIEDFRLERSSAFGATLALNNLKQDPIDATRDAFGGELADLVVEAAGEVDAINLSAELVRKYGDILYFGYPRAQTFAFNFDQLYHKCCRATTIVGASNEPNLTSMGLAVALVSSDVVDAKSLITHRVPFSKAIDAYEMHRTRSDGIVKIVIEMPGAESGL
jgi:threonine dehydrogenase-like Zn-dependent dehydrogenase